MDEPTSEGHLKTVVVTGGTRRLGKIISKRLAREGWRVLTTSSRLEAGADFVEDLSVPCGAVRLYSKVLDFLGGEPPIAWVNNAARVTGEDAAITQLDFETPRKLTMLMAGRETGRGFVVNILDSNVLDPYFVPRADFAAYDAAKIALRDETLHSAEMFSGTLNVTGVAPGPVLPPEGFHMKAGVPSDARPTPEAVAAAVSFLLSADFTRGIILPVSACEAS